MTRATLDYGRPETQFGATIEHTPDGGVAVTVPPGAGDRPGKFMAAVMTLFANLFPGPVFKPPAPRAVIRLTADGLSLTEPDMEAPHETVTQSWPLHDVGEVRANRYGPGLYVQLPGKENFDALVDVEGRLVELIGRELEEALVRLRIGIGPAPATGAGGAAGAATTPKAG